MKIIRDIQKEYEHMFSSKALALHNAFIIIDNKEIFSYEFIIKGHTAQIIANTNKYLIEVIEEFRFFNAIITEFSFNGEIIKKYNELNIIRLPLSILQPSQFYVCRQKLDSIENYMTENEIYIPVAIIDEEYVVLDGHTRLRFLHDNNVKMANCYIDEYDDSIRDFVYFAKEQNIRQVKDLAILEEEMYKELWHNFCDAYFEMKK